MFNKCIFVGNLTRDIELRYMPSGGALAKGAIAATHKYKDQQGNQKEEVCFLDFNIFGRSAEVANQYLRKGSKVLLEGRLVFEQWSAQDGLNKSKHALRVDNMTMLDPKPQDQNQYYQQQQNNQAHQYSQHNQQNSYDPNNYNQNQR